MPSSGSAALIKKACFVLRSSNFAYETVVSKSPILWFYRILCFCQRCCAYEQFMGLMPWSEEQKMFNDLCTNASECWRKYFLWKRFGCCF